MNPYCPGQDWSPIASSPANSQLAGLLAGFVFAGIVMVLSTRRSGPTRLQTLSLFCAAFIVLGLASYLFGLVTGDATQQACKRAATEAMIASGLLGVGAVAIISGISWLLAAYIGHDRGRTDKAADTERESKPDPNLVSLERLSRWMVYSIVAVVTLLLGVTTNGYVNTVYDSASTHWLQIVGLLYFVPVLGVVALLKRLRPSTSAALTVGVTSTMVYSVLGTVIDGAVTNTSAASWNPPAAPVGAIVAIVALVMPAPTLIALAYAVPRFSEDDDSARRTGQKFLLAVESIATSVVKLLPNRWRPQRARLFRSGFNQKLEGRS